MRFLLILAALPVWAAPYVVCDSMPKSILDETTKQTVACTDTNLKTVLEMVTSVDTVITEAGATFNLGDTWLPKTTGMDADGNVSWTRIRSSRAAKMRPGYRVCKENTPERPNCTSEPEYVGSGNFSTIAMGNAAAIRAFPSVPTASQINISSVDLGANTITTDVAMANGDEIAFTFTRRSPVICTGEDLPLYTGSSTGSYDSPCAGRADYVFDRFYSPAAMPTYVTGQAVRIFGKTLPPELTSGSVYYVRDLGGADNSWSGCTNCTFKLTATPGGAAINMTDSATVLGFYMESGIVPLTMNQKYYVMNSSGTTWQVAASKIGAAIDLTYSDPDASVKRIGRTQNVDWAGIEFKPQAGLASATYPMGLISNASNHPENQPRNFAYHHVYWHGNFGENGPAQGFAYHGDSLLIEDGYCDEIKNNADSQCVLQFTSSGKTVLRNNYMASGIPYMAGGSHPTIRGMIPAYGVIERNYFTKQLYQRTTFAYSTVGLTNAFRLTHNLSLAPCDIAFTVAPAHQCFAHAKDGTRVTLAQDAQWSSLSGSGTVAIGIASDHTPICRYTASLTLTPPAEFTCTQEAGETITWPTDGVEWAHIPVTSGSSPSCSIPSSCSAVNTLNSGRLKGWATKNSFELKLGVNYTLRGNVFGPQWIDGQWQGPTFHPSGASNNTEPLAYWARVGSLLLENNIIMDTATGISMTRGVQIPIGNNRKEANLGAVGGDNIVRNNLFVGGNMLNMGYTCSGSQAANGCTTAQGSYQSSSPAIYPGIQDLRFDHNTIIDLDHMATRLEVNADNLHFSNNAWVPILRTGVMPKILGDSRTSYCGLSGITRNANGSWQHNITMNRNNADGNADDVDAGCVQDGTPGDCSVCAAGSEWPATTYMMTGANNLVSTLFMAWAEHTNDANTGASVVTRTAATDLRINPASGYGAGTAFTTDGRAIGADQDEIEAETGPWGVDVIGGIPTFRIRTARTVSVNASSITLSYASNGSTCTIQGWTNAQYSGTPAIDTTDSGAPVSGGRLVVTLGSLSSSTRYHIKRRCGTGVDVLQAKTQ